MRKGLTEVVFILDRSGSMSGLEADTIGGFNSMIEKQRKEEGEAYISTVLFDDQSEVLYDRVPVGKVEPMNENQYYVRGCTALLDALGGVLVVMVNDRLAREFGTAHDAISVVHTVFLDAVNRWVDVAARAVEVGGVYVDDEGLAAHLLGVDACGIGEPVVGVDDVELLATRHHTGNDRIIVDFLVQIARVTACKLHATQVVDMHKVEVGIDMVAVSVIIVGIHEVANPTAYVVEVDVAVSDGHTVHRNDARVGAVLVAPWLRQAERYVDVALCVKTLRYTKIGCG